jgi:hypothetical protein
MTNPINESELHQMHQGISPEMLEEIFPEAPWGMLGHQIEEDLRDLRRCLDGLQDAIREYITLADLETERLLERTKPFYLNPTPENERARNQEERRVLYSLIGAAAKMRTRFSRLLRVQPRAGAPKP